MVKVDYKRSVMARLHMTIGMQTGMQIRCDDQFAYRSSCVNAVLTLTMLKR